MEHLKARNIHLEVCPSSNVQTSACASYPEHPVERLRRAGVSFGINTDTRTITNVTLREEYRRLRVHFGWGDAEFAACNRAALDAAFVEDAVKERLRAALRLS